MKKEDIKLLVDDGWTIENEQQPFKIKYKDGSVATGAAAHMVLTLLKMENTTAKDLSLDEVKKFNGYATVGDLLKFIEINKISHDSKILVERVEDIYYKKHNWCTLKKEGYQYYSALEFNKKIDSGEFLNKEQYPKINEKDLKKISNDDLNKLKVEYNVIWSPCLYKDDNNLYLDCHY